MTRTIPQPPWDLSRNDAIATGLSLLACIAEDVRRIANGTGRPTDGPCGHTIPSIGDQPPYVCALPAGHAGAHLDAGGASWTVGQTQVSNRGGDRPPLSETTRPGPQRGETRPATSSDDRGGRVADVVSHTGSVTTENSVSGTSTPTTPLARLRQIAEAAATAGGETYAGPWSWVDRPTETGLSREVLVGAESEMGHIADVVPWMPELGEHIATFDPPTALALLDAAILLDAAVQLDVIRDGSGLHRDAVRVLARLDEVAS